MAGLSYDFGGKVVIVTGGGSGIGRATAVKFAEHGASVLVTDVDEGGGKETVDAIVDSGRSASFLRCDVSSAIDAEAMALSCVDKYGRIDFAFNNAGVVPDKMANVAELETDQWLQLVNINLNGVFYCMKYQLQQMLRQGGGVVINTSSRNGFTGVPGGAAYSASKHGVLGLTKSAALEYANQGIRVNALCPGATKTAMTDSVIERNPEFEDAYINMEPMHRMGQPEEMAEAVLWLCSDAASFVTGHAMAVDGGLCANPI